MAAIHASSQVPRHLGLTTSTLAHPSNKRGRTPSNPNATAVASEKLTFRGLSTSLFARMLDTVQLVRDSLHIYVQPSSMVTLFPKRCASMIEPHLHAGVYTIE